MLCEELCELESKDFPDGMEMDDYDRYAEHYLIYSRGGEVMGSFRLIYRCPLGLPSLKAYGLDDIAREIGEENICELSRIYIDPRFRSMENTLQLFTRIMVFGCRFMRRKKMTHALCAVEENLYRLIRLSRAPFKKVAEAKPNYVRLRVPILLDMAELSEAQPRYCRYKRP
jgi:N-acyl-L-homoserine lactone synthetase